MHKMVQGFTEVAHFTAFSLLDPNSFESKTRAAVSEYFQEPAEDKKAQIKQKMESELSEAEVKSLASVGAKSPIDFVDVKLDFGNFLYDLYVLGSPSPTAPLAIAANQRRLMSLAGRLEKKEFVIKDEELAVLKSVLENDNKWESAKFNAYVDVDKTNRIGLVLTPSGLRFYNKVLNAAVLLFEAPETKQAEETSDAPEKAQNTGS